ncbi:hypothetical protein ITI46_06350 [Streptomyces oryzae]|uniref:Uncharacterized protein n=1 Tax=Streptomyces oryzae TaxID=1434886 RepID=A0ABS3X7G6_9ACTN|nr:hypothetical protein [Streptomyces oryzae]MBO8191314.1 hypothetical protein [Streptomyces oryzae]
MSLKAGVAAEGFPVIGHGWALLRHGLAFLESLPQHGNLVEVRLGPAWAYVPCRPELVWRMLTDDQTFDKGGPQGMRRLAHAAVELAEREAQDIAFEQREEVGPYECLTRCSGPAAGRDGRSGPPGAAGAW